MSNELVENAIQKLMEQFPEAERGATATPGHNYYEKVLKAALSKGLLHVCTCGQRKLGWAAPEFIASMNNKVWSVSYDLKSRKISCGPNGFHSSRYSDTPSCED